MVLKKNEGKVIKEFSVMIIPGYRKCVGCRKMPLGKESFNGTGNILFLKLGTKFRNIYIIVCCILLCMIKIFHNKNLKIL